jgi:hypothetical protein
MMVEAFFIQGSDSLQPDVTKLCSTVSELIVWLKNALPRSVSSCGISMKRRLWRGTIAMLMSGVLTGSAAAQAAAPQKPSRELKVSAAPVIPAPPELAAINTKRISLLPAYDNHGDAGRLHGVIRIHGTELTQHLIHLWEDGFLKQHPLPRFNDLMWPTGFSGLAAETADINVMGHDAWYSDLKALEYQDRRAMLQALADDPEGIAYVALGNATPELRARLKVIPVGTADSGEQEFERLGSTRDHSGGCPARCCNQP